MLADRFHGRPCTHCSNAVYGLWLCSGAQTICNVKLFQQYLQERVKTLISKNLADLDRWDCEYSPR